MAILRMLRLVIYITNLDPIMCVFINATGGFANRYNLNLYFVNVNPFIYLTPSTLFLSSGTKIQD